MAIQFRCNSCKILATVQKSILSIFIFSTLLFSATLKDSSGNIIGTTDFPTDPNLPYQTFIKDGVTYTTFGLTTSPPMGTILSTFDPSSPLIPITSTVNVSTAVTAVSALGASTQFLFEDPFCCCNDAILLLATESTAHITLKNLLPATGNLSASKATVSKNVDNLKLRIKNLKVLNGIYSFSDIEVLKEIDCSDKNNGTDQSTSGDGEGCQPLDLSNEADWESYMTNTINVFESGGSYTAENPTSGAYGRYQFIPDTRDIYIARLQSQGVPVNINNWKEPQYQDMMFRELTRDNASTLSSKGVAITNCSLYLSHQQGVAGYISISTGELWSNVSYSTLSNNMYSNMPSSWKERIGDPTNFNEVKEVYMEYWGGKFNGDLVSGLCSLTDEEMASLRESRAFYWRKGILLESQRINSLLEKAIKRVDIKSTREMNKAKQAQTQEVIGGFLR